MLQLLKTNFHILANLSICCWYVFCMHNVKNCLNCAVAELADIVDWPFFISLVSWRCVYNWPMQFDDDFCTLSNSLTSGGVIVCSRLASWNMSFRRKLLGAFVIVFLLLVFQRWLFALLNMLLNGNSDLVFAQMVDYFGLPPTLYTGNISCPGCNQFNVPYVIQPHQTAYCTHDKPVFLLILVASHPENYYRRIAIRRSWGSLSAHNRKSIRTYFVVGRSANRTTQDSLEDEAAQWHDVLQVF